MKKTWLVLFIVAIAFQAKAQQGLLTEPADSSLRKLFAPSLKLKPADSSLYGKFFKLPSLTQKTQPNTALVFANTETFFSTMPIVKVEGGNMPVAKLGGSGEHYAMLVKKYKVVNPLVKVQPIAP